MIFEEAASNKSTVGGRDEDDTTTSANYHHHQPPTSTRSSLISAATAVVGENGYDEDIEIQRTDQAHATATLQPQGTHHHPQGPTTTPDSYLLKRRKLYRSSYAVVLLLLIPAVIAIAILLTGNNSSGNDGDVSAPTLDSVAPPSTSPSSMLYTISETTRAAVDQVLSLYQKEDDDEQPLPQWSPYIAPAREWLFTQDLLLEEKLQDQDQQRFIERVVLVLFSFATHLNFHQPGTGYCTWHPGIKCSEDGRDYLIVVRINNQTNIMDGVLPPLTPLEHLEEFDLANNQLQGTIPTNLFAPNSKLFYFDLSYNNFTGTIPNTITTFSNLQYLYLDHNGFQGGIVDTTQDPRTVLPVLKDIWVDHNLLTGSIPTWVTAADSLRTFHCSHNELNGTLPDMNPEAFFLTFIDLSWNRFTGTLPVSYFELPSLITLYVDGNQLTGPLPLTSQVRGLKNLYLNSNQFNGTYPETFGDNFPEMEELQLFDNDFEPSTLDACEKWPFLEELRVDCVINCTCCTEECYTP